MQNVVNTLCTNYFSVSKTYLRSVTYFKPSLVLFVSMLG